MNHRLKLGVALWVAGMAGVVAVSITVIPQLLSGADASVPIPLAIAASMLQSAILLALAVWAGVAFAKPLGLGAPAIEAALSGSSVLDALRAQTLPAIGVGLLVAAMLVYVTGIAPTELQALTAKFEISLLPKLLYGGVTEEIIMRWGLMTLLIWLPWRVLQRRDGPPRTRYVVIGLLGSALLFAVGHLPAVVAMGAPLSPPVVAYIIVGNMIPGLLFGILYWRRGLEAAILAHALAHAASTLVFQWGEVA